MKATHLLIVLNVLIYGAMLGVAGGAEFRHFSSGTLVQFGALNAQLVRDGDWWRLVTMMFIHLTPAHLAMNMVALWQAGGGLEARYGRGRYVALYVVAGLGGSAASLFWNWGGLVTSAGASGAISGLIGAGVVAGHLEGGVEGRKLRDGMLRWAMLVLVFGLVAGADNAAHAGGFVVGAGAAWLIERSARARSRPQKAGGVGLESIVLVALVGGAFGLAGRAHKIRGAVEEAVNAGVEQSRGGHDAEALAEFRKAAALDPKSAVARFDLALSYLHLKDHESAIREARAAIALDGKMAEPHYVLAAALEAQGRLADSNAELARYTALGGKLDAPDGGAHD